jgi:hypothetical protein
MKYVDGDGDGEEPALSTPYDTEWWNRQTDYSTASLRKWGKTVAAPWIHKNVTRPLKTVEKTYLSIGSAGFAAKNPFVTSLGLGGAGIAEVLCIAGLSSEAWLSSDKEKTKELAWETTSSVTVNGIDYVLKSSPAGQIAWFVADEFGNLVRELTSKEVEEVGLDDSVGTSEKMDDDSTKRKSSGD